MLAMHTATVAVIDILLRRRTQAFVRDDEDVGVARICAQVAEHCFRCTLDAPRRASLDYVIPSRLLRRCKLIVEYEHTAFVRRFALELYGVQRIGDVEADDVVA